MTQVIQYAAVCPERKDRSRAVMRRLGFDYRKDIVINDEPFALYALARPH